jgi:dephospho-CoA kinase
MPSFILLSCGIRKLWVAQHANSPYVVKEAAIMKAAGPGNALDYVVVVDSPENLRVKRILQRDNRSEQEIRAIMKRQVSDESGEKLRISLLQMIKLLR